MMAWTCVQRRGKKDHIEKDVRWWHEHVCRGECMNMEREEGPH